jgi:hypothetical protein
VLRFRIPSLSKTQFAGALVAGARLLAFAGGEPALGDLGGIGPAPLEFARDAALDGAGFHGEDEPANRAVRAVGEAAAVALGIEYQAGLIRALHRTFDVLARAREDPRQYRDRKVRPEHASGEQDLPVRRRQAEEAATRVALAGIDGPGRACRHLVLPRRIAAPRMIFARREGRGNPSAGKRRLERPSVVFARSHAGEG